MEKLYQLDGDPDEFMEMLKLSKKTELSHPIDRDIRGHKQHKTTNKASKSKSKKWNGGSGVIDDNISSNSYTFSGSNAIKSNYNLRRKNN